MATDYYELLGVPRNASDDDIKKAYRRLARELHPDVNPGDAEAEERFKEVSLAYETLSNPETRQRYDMFGPEGIRGSGAAGGGFSGDNFGANLGDIFDAFFGGAGPFGGGRGGRRAGPPRGNDLETRLDLDFTTAAFGGQQDVSVRAPVVCTTCTGSGAKPGTEAATCSQCGGTGEVRRVRQSILGQMVTSSPCNRCGGMGMEIPSPCPDCRGEGRRTEPRTYTVDVPAGVADGNTLRLTGKGAAGPRGGPPGDLFVHLRVAPHPRFEREGYDLHHDLLVGVAQAALGVHVPFETLDGVEDLVVPAGSQSGRVFRLRDRGVPYVDGRGRGDLLVHLVVETPTNLTRAQEDLLRQFAAERGEEVAPPDTGLFSRIKSAFK